MTALSELFKQLPLILTSVTLNAFAQLLLKKGMQRVGTLDVVSLITKATTLFSNGFLWSGMACYAASIALWFVVLSRNEVSFAYPFLSIGYILVAILGWYFFNESLTTWRIAGIGLIYIGVILISKS